MSPLVYIGDEIGRWLLSRDWNFSVFKALAFDSVVESLIEFDSIVIV